MIETEKQYRERKAVHELMTNVMFAINHPQIYQNYTDEIGKDLKEYEELQSMVKELKKKHLNIGEQYRDI